MMDEPNQPTNVREFPRQEPSRALRAGDYYLEEINTALAAHTLTATEHQALIDQCQAALRTLTDVQTDHFGELVKAGDRYRDGILAAFTTPSLSSEQREAILHQIELLGAIAQQSMNT